MEFDLRKPKLRERFGLQLGKGIVNVLLGEVKPEAIAQPVLEGYHLDLMISGPIPPNPSELIAMPAMEKLKQFLDEHYDVVVIDTPPFGLVTDAQKTQIARQNTADSIHTARCRLQTSRHTDLSDESVPPKKAYFPATRSIFGILPTPRPYDRSPPI